MSMQISGACILLELQFIFIEFCGSVIILIKGRKPFMSRGGKQLGRGKNN